MKKLSVVLIGAGSRGDGYSDIIKENPDKFKIVGVAEPIDSRRNAYKQKHNLTEEQCYIGWEEMLSKPKMADLALICTMDDMHYEPALKAIAQTAKECADIARAAEEKGVKVLVCHVLRYTPFFKKIKQTVMDGIIGDVMSVIHVEGVGNLHQSHSYIRGNWHKEAETTPMLLAKCCHDIDIIQWILDKPCKKVQSFGELTYFKEENAPKGAPKRCIDGGCPIEDTCPYNCKKLYYDNKEGLWFRTACTKNIAKQEILTDEEVMQSLKTTDYGLCVFKANNDVVDHQIVNMEFEGGTTVTLTMNAFNKGGRYIRLFGTKGELYANMTDEEITLYTFEDKKYSKIQSISLEESIMAGHGGGDTGIINELYEYLNGDYKGFCAADIDISVKNHLIGFAAEKSRHNDTVESVDKFFQEYGLENN